MPEVYQVNVVEGTQVFDPNRAAPFAQSLGVLLLLVIAGYGYLTLVSLPRMEGLWPNRSAFPNAAEFVALCPALQTVSETAEGEEPKSPPTGYAWNLYRSRSWSTALFLSTVGVFITAGLFRLGHTIAGNPLPF